MSLIKSNLFQEIVDGLQAKPASISPKYFYDELGSSLFQAITHLEEYYPTRVERGIMQSKLSQITQAICPVDVIVELGAGNCEKVRPLLDTISPKQYRALDISVDFLEAALAVLHHDYPVIDMRGGGCRYHPRTFIPRFTRSENIILLSWFINWEL